MPKCPTPWCLRPLDHEGPCERPLTPTDHPSNPPSQEPTLEQIKAASDLLMPNKGYMNSDAFGRVVMAVAAALAAQEARHQERVRELARRCRQCAMGK